MIVVFEGLDGSGKTTQIKLLEQHLKSLDIRVKSLREPGGTPYAEALRPIIKEGPATNSIHSRLLSFYAARMDLIENEFDKHDFILLDRFVDSTLAYQVSSGVLKETVMGLNTLFNVPKPDICFYLRAELDVLESRCGDKSKNDVYDNASRLYKQSVLTQYDNMDSYSKKRFIVDASRTQDEVFDDIVSILTKEL